MSSTEAEKKASVKYRKAHTMKYSLILNKRTDSDVIVWLNSQENKRGSILRAIRNEMTQCEMTKEV